MIDAMWRALKVLENKKLRMDEHLIPIVVDDLRQAIEQAEKDDMYRNPDTGNPCEGWDTSDMAHRSGGLSVEQAEKEPVKCTCGYSIGHPLVSKCICTPRKEWVGLTTDEIFKEAWKGRNHSDFARGAEWAQAKLKEKNNV